MDVNNVTEKLVGMQKRLFNFAYSLTMNRDDAQDLLQSTSLKVLNNQEKFVNNDNFSGWIFTIMNRYASNPGEETPDSTYTVKEINRAIKSLAEEYRIPFSLYLSGYKYQEIADRMNLPIGTVKSRIYASRQQLQSKLRDYHYDA